jgi:F420-non-reducing hydrogenase small subunit
MKERAMNTNDPNDPNAATATAATVPATTAPKTAPKTTAKTKVAFYWCASCGGCEEAVVDLAEGILPVLEAVEIVLWPVALDYKLEDVRAWRRGEVAVAFINGSVRSSEQEMWVKLLREKCGLVVAFGACAHLGGIPGLANATTRAEILANKYLHSPTVDNPAGIVPQRETWVGNDSLDLPEVWNTVRALDQVIDVDYYLPGCAPPPELIGKAVQAILQGKLPPKGAVLAPAKALCETCPRNDSKPAEFRLEGFRRIATAAPDPDKCFLADGFVCLGPATRGGCGERCIRGNMPCRGCFGPPPGALDQGAKFLSALGAVAAGETEQQADAFAATMADPLGTLYRFSLPTSLLRRRHVPTETAR